MAEESAGERTESATPRRREKARDKGQVIKSQEVNSLFVLAAGTVMLLVLARYLTETIGRNAAYLFSQAHILRVDNLGGLRVMLVGNLQNLALTLAPVVAVVLVAGIASNVMQVGFKISTSSMSFDLSKLNAITGMKKFFQKRTFADLVKNVVKIGLIGIFGYLVIKAIFGELIASPLLPLPAIIALAQGKFRLLMTVLLALMAVISLADWVYQKWQFEQDTKMSRQELKEEAREYEGDPQIKARIRAIQYETARKRMLADVPRADVVLTNPTHFAVALKYEQGSAAPVVVAKGADYLAQKIKEIARQSRVPVIENKALARALYRDVKVGRAIPESLFHAVAEILAYVYRLKKA
jgi:flagellar biosynthetic protein FlhB